jgi:hypothetical protein
MKKNDYDIRDYTDLCYINSILAKLIKDISKIEKYIIDPESDIPMRL